METEKEKFLKNLTSQLNKKKRVLEEKITQAGLRRGQAESARASWSDHTLTDIEEEVAILTQQLRTTQAQLKEIQGFLKQKTSFRQVVPGSLVMIAVDGEKQTLLVTNSPVGSFEQGLLSTQSPLGQALLNKEASQAFTLPTPIEPLKVKLLGVV